MIGSRLGRTLSVLLTLGVAGIAAAPAAEARVGVFLGFGPAFFYPPPAYYYPPPPVYYPPPPVWYTPPPPPVDYTPPAYPSPSVARSCYAGSYVCPMQTRVAPGTTCWCPDNAGGRAYGTAR